MSAADDFLRGARASLDEALDRRVLRKLLKADLDGFDRQIGGFRSQIRTLEAQIQMLAAYRLQTERKLAELGGDDDDE